jgi:hypothetical protein
MAGWLIAITGLIYAYVAADLAWHGKTGLAMPTRGMRSQTSGCILLQKGRKVMQ